MSCASLVVLLVVQALGHVQSAKGELTVFESRQAFLAAAPIEITQDFESFASPTHFSTAQVAFDEVIFSAIPTPTTWGIVNNVGLMRTNTLGTIAVVRHEIGFGEGRYVNAFGFTFLGGGSANGVPSRYDIAVREINGNATTLPLSLFADTYYFGFVSNRGIERISIAPVPIIDGVTTFWRYDDFSRSARFVVPEPNSAYLLSVGVASILICLKVSRNS
jgi:hypothetical protein